MIKIKAGEKKKKKISMISKIKDRFKYDIKKMETIVGKYDINSNVILHQDAIMKAYCYYAITQKTQGNKEIMGWLAGKIDKNKIEIVDAYVGDCTSSSGYTELDPRETVKMMNMARERGLQLVGQWHTHPGMSVHPSFEDKDTMQTLSKTGIEKPIMIIVNSDEFWLGTIQNNFMKKVDFVIPPKTDNKFSINLGYINGEYTYPIYDTVNDMLYGDTGLVAFYGMIGNFFLLGIDTILPFLNLDRWVDYK